MIWEKFVEEKMKKILAFIVLAALLINCGSIPRYYVGYTRSEQIVISGRVGDTIDPGEQEQFGLFPVIEDFKAATFYGIEGGGYEVEILTVNKKLVAVNRDPKGIEILRNYIESYAKMQYSKEDFEKKWKVVDYDFLGQPITEYEVYGNKKLSYSTCCGTGLGLLGIIPVGWIALSKGSVGSAMGMDDTIFVVGIVLCGVVGMLIGSIMDKNVALKTLKTIKEARKPKVVE
jgi:hypothetical protein